MKMPNPDELRLQMRDALMVPAHMLVMDPDYFEKSRAEEYARESKKFDKFIRSIQNRWMTKGT